jgi:hypothetical protein
MPNISFDIFFNDDTINLTASRSKFAPKVKPTWKIRSAPKLEPAKPKTPGVSVFAPGAQRPKPTPRVEELSDSASSSPAPTPKKPASNPAVPQVKKAPPKLKDLPQTKSTTAAPQKNIPKLNTAPKAPTSAASTTAPKAPAPATSTSAPKKIIPKLKDQAKPTPPKLSTPSKAPAQGTEAATRPTRFARKTSS